MINIPFIPNYSEITLEPKVVYVSDEDFSYEFDTNARRYAGTTKQWLEAGGDIDFPKTIGFQVGIILWYCFNNSTYPNLNYFRLNAMWAETFFRVPLNEWTYDQVSKNFWHVLMS